MTDETQYRSVYYLKTMSIIQTYNGLISDGEI